MKYTCVSINGSVVNLKDEVFYLWFTTDMESDVFGQLQWRCVMSPSVHHLKMINPILMRHVSVNPASINFWSRLTNFTSILVYFYSCLLQYFDDWHLINRRYLMDTKRAFIYIPGHLFCTQGPFSMTGLWLPSRHSSFRNGNCDISQEVIRDNTTWFTRLDPRYRVPRSRISACGGPYAW